MPSESAQVLDECYILATSTRVDDRTCVIKHGDSFGVFDHGGMIRQAGLGELGLYHDGTRFLSRFEIAMDRRRPLFLNSTVREDNILSVDLANPDLPDREQPLPRDSVHLFAQSLLWDRGWHVRLTLHNYARDHSALDLALWFDADFADIFEVRGMHRLRRGRRTDPVIGRDEIVLAYEGLDHAVRSTRIAFAPEPVEITANVARYHLELAAQESISLELNVGFELAPAVRTQRPEFTSAHVQARAVTDRRRETSAVLRAGNPKFDEWLERSSSDIQMMITDTPFGPYPYAGVPWFSTPFGRDGIITAYQMLWIDPALARGVLAFLAGTQATEIDAENDAEPGKIIHEVRGGEMAALGEIPFGRYYGSIDATPLFVVLAEAYFMRTGDRSMLESIWPHIDRALLWIDRHGDSDGDGFIEYARRSKRGLASQGWKDSVDSISHADGQLATGPIALCEVQAYVYAARRAGAAIARRLGLPARAETLETQAEQLRIGFESSFWCEELGSYALALDGDKRPCRVRSSNAGHCLFSGIAASDRARCVVDTLLSAGSFSGWGVRTLDAREVRYNPLSYHNGSVWPHDNAVIAMGMARYGHKLEAARLLTSLFGASLHFDLLRTPELFCGLDARLQEGPTHYPVACAPQAWAAGAAFMLLQACLGLEIDALSSKLVFDRPVLPSAIGQLHIEQLAIGTARIDLVLDNHINDVGIHVIERQGHVELLIRK